jgi:hypothetical protein
MRSVAGAVAGAVVAALKTGVRHAESTGMLAAVAHVFPAPLSGGEVIITIIGGTMLTISLTRPRLRWIERVTEGSERRRMWAERALTAFSFVMIGYAGTSVWMELYGLGHAVNDLLVGAATFLVVYAAIVHFEPFVCEWRLRNGVETWLFYLSFASLCTVIGCAVWYAVLTSSLAWPIITLILLLLVLTAMTWHSAHFLDLPPGMRYWDLPPEVRQRLPPDVRRYLER